jgi:hypothetical protein
MHLLHAIQQARPSAHRILSILIAEVRDRKKYFQCSVKVHLSVVANFTDVFKKRFQLTTSNGIRRVSVAV